MSDPLSPTPLSEQERALVEIIRRWPLLTDDVAGLLAIIDRLSRSEPPPVAEGVVLPKHIIDGFAENRVWLDGAWWEVTHYGTEWDNGDADATIRRLPAGPDGTPLVPVLPDPQEADAFPPDPPEEN